MSTSDIKFVPFKAADGQPIFKPYSVEDQHTALDDIEYTGNAEVDSKAELNEFQKQAKEELRREKKRQDEMFDSEFWLAIYFQNRSQKESFLAGLALLIESAGDKYIDGQLLAAKLGIELPKASEIKAQNKISATWNEFID